jgi:hypothetical protein
MSHFGAATGERLGSPLCVHRVFAVKIQRFSVSAFPPNPCSSVPSVVKTKSKFFSNGQPPGPPEAAKNTEMTRIPHKTSNMRASPCHVSRFTIHVSPSSSVTTFRASEQPHWAPVWWRAWEANPWLKTSAPSLLCVFALKPFPIRV